MSPEPIWSIEEHTKAKHELLRRYLGAWFPIMAYGGSRRVVFLDGFAGPGIYEDGEPGSPIIALQTLVEHAHFGDWVEHTQFFFLFVEADRTRSQSLEGAIASYWGARVGGKPRNVGVSIINGGFAEVAPRIADALAEQQIAQTAVLAFIDPFGWSGVPMTLIRDLLAFDRCEVLFNFMFDSVNRFVTDKRRGVAVTFEQLFGTKELEHARAIELVGTERKEFLSGLYARQLRDVAGFTYVRKFELMDTDRGRTAYFLMFGTRRKKGLAVMKDAMWSLDPVEGARFAGSTGNQGVLFHPEPDFGPLRQAILDRFSAQTVTVDQIEDFVIEETDYKVSQYKRQVLRALEQEGLLVCESGRSRRLTYPKGSVLRFAT